MRARLAQATRTPPNRLRLAGVVLAVLTIAFGGLTAWQLEDRARAAERVVTHSQPLSRDAAEIHRRLAGAATTATTGFLLAGNEPTTVRKEYEQDLARTAELITSAAALAGTASRAKEPLTLLGQQLTVYAGLVENARADNRQGIPLGGAYLRYASEQMQKELLQTAGRLSDYEDRELAADYAAAKAVPWAAYGLGLVTLAALVWVQLTLFRRTNRVFNIGLLGATAAVLAGTLWLTAAGLGTTFALQRSFEQGAAPLRALNSARVDVLTARLNENLHFVARGSTAKYTDAWTATITHLDGSAPDGTRRPGGGTLGEALKLAPADAAGDIAKATEQYGSWLRQHEAARALEVNSTDYEGALKATVTADGGGTTADAFFKATDEALGKAAEAEQKSLTNAAKGTDWDLRAAAVAVALSGLVAAAAALRGLGRRLAEYR
ncbi:hypothetical protein AB0E96_03680 [Kitasatospora sp. NPDC036755]|uniref:hypothetical protein n=1 Tax=Kitasatospora sp. NPDC036755 TaxID=3154600 RepID=UPI0033F6A298